MKNKLITKITTIMMCAIMLVLSTANVQAAGLDYTYETIDKSDVVTGSASTITVNWKYKKAVINGDSEAANKINAYIGDKCDAFFEFPSGCFEMAEYDVEDRSWDDTYEDTVTQQVLYNGKIISIKQTTNWYAGGVGNTDIEGLNFNASTGKRIHFTWKI